MYLRISTILLILLWIWLMIPFLQIDVKKEINTFKGKIIRKINTFLAKREKRQIEGIKKGEIKGNLKLFLEFNNDLIIDLGLKKTRIMRAEFMFFIITACGITGILIGIIIFDSLLVGVILIIPFAIVVYCLLFTLTSNQRSQRIKDIMLSNNIISNNIKKGIKNVVYENINDFPIGVRLQYQMFYDNIEFNGYDMEEALYSLSVSLGGNSLDFLERVLVAERYQEEGYIDTFKDEVQKNNIKMQERVDMERVASEINMQFTTSLAITGTFLFGSIMVIPILHKFYLDMVFGNIVLILDIIVIVFVYMKLTMIKAEDV